MFLKITSLATAALALSAGAALAHNPARCPVSGMDRRICCASKASPMPPCCQRVCDTPARLVR